MERVARVRSGVQGFVFKGRAPLLLNPENCRQAGEKAASIKPERAAGDEFEPVALSFDLWSLWRGFKTACLF